MELLSKKMLFYMLCLALSISCFNCQDTNKGRFYKGDVNTKMPIESKYKKIGSEQVAKVEFNSDNPTIGKIVAVYPLSIPHTGQVFPLINIGNASNTTAYDLIEAMEHLASWGYVVIGNMDKQTGSGSSISQTLDEFLCLIEQQDNIFYGKIDTTKIGIAVTLRAHTARLWRQQHTQTATFTRRSICAAVRRNKLASTSSGEQQTLPRLQPHC